VDFVRRIERDSPFQQVALYMRLAGTIWSGLFNFGSFRITEHDDEYGIEISEGEHFTDMTAESILGFMQRIADEAGPELVHVTHTRPRPDLLRYRFRWRVPRPSGA
jgi:hypothetical protein